MASEVIGDSATKMAGGITPIGHCRLRLWRCQPMRRKAVSSVRFARWFTSPLVARRSLSRMAPVPMSTMYGVSIAIAGLENEVGAAVADGTMLGRAAVRLIAAAWMA